MFNSSSMRKFHNTVFQYFTAIYLLKHSKKGCVHIQSCARLVANFCLIVSKEAFGPHSFEPDVSDSFFSPCSVRFLPEDQ